MFSGVNFRLSFPTRTTWVFGAVLLGAVTAAELVLELESAAAPPPYWADATERTERRTEALKSILTFI
jgi:hypothetical protein